MSISIYGVDFNGGSNPCCGWQYYPHQGNPLTPRELQSLFDRADYEVQSNRKRRGEQRFSKTRKEAYLVFDRVTKTRFKLNLPKDGSLMEWYSLLADAIGKRNPHAIIMITH